MINEYEVIFTNEKKRHTVRVKATAIIPAIETAVVKHFGRYTNALLFEIVEARRIDG